MTKEKRKDRGMSTSEDPSNTKKGLDISWTSVLLGIVVTGVLLAVGLVVSIRDPIPELTESDFFEAKDRWKRNEPANYDMELSIGGVRSGAVHVEVRDGQVTAMSRDGRTPSQRRTWNAWTVDGQFETIEREIEMAADPAGEMQTDSKTKILIHARFHPQFGYPARFRRVVLGSGPEMSWEVTRFEARP